MHATLYTLSPQNVFGSGKVIRKSYDRNSFAIVCSANTSMKVAITGATGLVGTRLTQALTQQGHEVVALTRDVGSARSKLRYPKVSFKGPGEWEAAVCGCTGVVNLAGEPIATRWSDEVKMEIKRSRVNVTTKVANAINKCPADQKPKVLISSSAIGFYGISQTATFNEDSQGGNDFLATVCKDWEAAAKKVEGSRLVIFRTGIVLAKEGGALGKMLPIFNIFAGGPLGSGQQFCSWVHRDDLVGLIIEALQDEKYSGVYNATAPNPVRMSELCSELGTVLGRPSWLPVPEFALQTLLGEGAMVVLEGQKVLPVKTEATGFRFRFPKVAEALRNIANT